MAKVLFSILAICALLISARADIHVSLMMPLTTVNNDGSLNNVSGLSACMKQAQAGGVNGVMLDFWWGIVEEAGPKIYNWTPYIQFVQLAEAAGLHVQPMLSFHQCGDNPGDECYIPLPTWVLAVGSQNPNIFYTDAEGSSDPECAPSQMLATISIHYNQALFQGRNALQMYQDYMQSFYTTFGDWLGSTITQIQIGLGPTGELRYPAYQSSKWTYCGVGEFQCYDQYMLASLKNAAQNAGQPQWGGGGPINAGTYNSQPSQTGFFSDNTANNYASVYGQFFLSWYSGMLLQHGAAILSLAANVFDNRTQLAGKIAGIHWWYDTDNHAAELTAGYYNTNNNNAYLQIAQMFSKYSATFDFTCLEMTDSPTCNSAPQVLDHFLSNAVHTPCPGKAGIPYAGENALALCDPTCNEYGFSEIITECTQYGDIERFTYLRMDQYLMDNPNNWQDFTTFVSKMHAS